ncbi:hypothetical protein Tco_1012728 [Tanacetum coccineum]
MKDVYTTLSGFFGEQVTPLGEVSVLIMIGEAPHHRSEQITFLIVRSNSPNNMLLRRTAIAGLGMVPSTMHSAVLYQLEAGPSVIMSEYQNIRRCKVSKKEYQDIRNEKLVKRLRETPPEALQLPTKAKQELIKLLKDNADVYACQYSNMTGIPQNLKIRGTNFDTEHKLNEVKKIMPVRQKKRRMAPKRVTTTSKEVEELRKA